MKDVTKGDFMASLVRSNKQIKEDRALSIAKSTETTYRRYIEDLQTDYDEIQRQRDNMLDLSPENAQSLKLASDFNAGLFMSQDEAFGLKLRDLEIKLEIMTRRYQKLFGPKPATEVETETTEQ